MSIQKQGSGRWMTKPRCILSVEPMTRMSTGWRPPTRIEMIWCISRYRVGMYRSGNKEGWPEAWKTRARINREPGVISAIFRLDKWFPLCAQGVIGIETLKQPHDHQRRTKASTSYSLLRRQGLDDTITILAVSFLIVNLNWLFHTKILFLSLYQTANIFK